jgi:hypothetical protein
MVSGYGRGVLPDSWKLPDPAEARGARALEFEAGISPEFEFEFLTVGQLFRNG